MGDFNWKFPKGMKPTGRNLREACEATQGEFYKKKEGIKNE